MSQSTKKILSLASSAMLAGAVQAGNAAGAATNTPPTTMSAAALSALNKAEIAAMLATIEKAAAPEPKMGAMCYEPAMQLYHMEYICPVCGEKTLYTNSNSDFSSAELEDCRRVFTTMPKRETLTLDESSFCKKCTPGTNAPALKLQIRFDNGNNNTVSGITGDDLRMLKGFLSGKLDCPTENDGTTALKNKLPRLRKILGITDEK